MNFDNPLTRWFTWSRTNMESEANNRGVADTNTIQLAMYISGVCALLTVIKNVKLFCMDLRWCKVGHYDCHHNFRFSLPMSMYLYHGIRTNTVTNNVFLWNIQQFTNHAIQSYLRMEFMRTNTQHNTMLMIPTRPILLSLYKTSVCLFFLSILFFLFEPTSILFALDYHNERTNHAFGGLMSINLLLVYHRRMDKMVIQRYILYTLRSIYQT